MLGRMVSGIPLSPSLRPTHWKASPHSTWPIASVMITKLTPLTRTATIPRASPSASVAPRPIPTAAHGEKKCTSAMATP